MKYKIKNFKKRIGVTILISDQADINTISINSNKEGHFIIIKGLIHQKDTT